MKLEDQVASVDLSKKLRELGIAQEGLYSWLYHTMWGSFDISHMKVGALELLAKANPEDIGWGERLKQGIYSAFSVAELTVMLPKSLGLNDGHNWGFYHRHCWKGESVGYSAYGVPSIEQDWYEHEAEAKCNMLIHLLEKSFITPEECNKRLQK